MDRVHANANAAEPADAPSIRPVLQRASGRAGLVFAERHGTTVPLDLAEAGCARVRFPRRRAGEPPEAVLLNTAGGLTDGDRYAIDLEVRSGHAVVTTQAAERIYRSRGGPARLDLKVRLGPGARLDLLPQETILFDRSNLERRAEITLAAPARLLLCDMLVLGRHASGEIVRSGRLDDRWRIRVGDRLVLADMLRLEGDLDAVAKQVAVTDGARAWASILYVAPDAAAWVEPMRGWLAETGVRAAAGERMGVLRARLFAASGHPLRRALVHALDSFRTALAGRPVKLPRVWAL